MDESTRNEPPSTDDLRKSYDEIPYLSPPQPFTHISRIAAIGQLRGVMSPPPSRCRVLELGCSDGGNLLPMAFQYSESQFVGIDLSPVQVKIGCQRVQELALTNLEIRLADILELNEKNLGQFDYIILHGVYSWVPVEVRERILQTCQNHLTQSGIAYISFNTYPGWRGKQSLREILRYHTRNIVDLRKKVEAAFELLSILPLPDSSPHSSAALLVKQLREKLDVTEDAATYLLHEYLVDVNEPFYFSEFLKQIGSFGLQYLDDVRPGNSSLDSLTPKAQNWVRGRQLDFLEQQQYVDIIGNASFRRSLVCHSSLSLERKLSIDHMRSLHVMTRCQFDEAEDSDCHFKTKSGRRFKLEHSGLKLLLKRLIDAYPESVPVGEVFDLLGASVTDDQVVEMLEDLLNGSAIEFIADANHCSRTVDERPFSSRLVRYQAEQGFATSSAHSTIRIDNPFDQQLLSLLNGSRTVSEITAMLRERLTVDKPISDAEWETLVRDQLSRFAHHGLLEMDSVRMPSK